MSCDMYLLVITGVCAVVYVAAMVHETVKRDGARMAVVEFLMSVIAAFGLLLLMIVSFVLIDWIASL